MKKEESTQTPLEARMNASSLFQTYCSAFQSATGLILEIAIEPPAVSSDALTVPVLLGRTSPFFLVVSGKVTGEGSLALFEGLLEAFAIQLGDEINRAFIADNGSDPAPVKRAKDIIKAELSRKLTLEQVAAEVDVCPFHLCRLFKEHAGLTMTEYSGRLRVERARQLLINPKLQVAEVSERVGFCSISQFNRTFRKYAGESPSEYRDRLCELENCILHAA